MFVMKRTDRIMGGRTEGPIHLDDYMPMTETQPKTEDQGYNMFDLTIAEIRLFLNRINPENFIRYICPYQESKPIDQIYPGIEEYVKRVKAWRDRVKKHRTELREERRALDEEYRLEKYHKRI